MTTIDEKIDQLNDKDGEIYQEAQNRIDKEVKYVGVKPYSHNIISLSLGQVSQELGSEYADQLIDEFDLEDLGWNRGG